MPSFYIPLSGLDADSTALNTIANNLANMNTTGYKAQTTNFFDLFYQQLGSNGSGDEIQGGTGVRVSSNSTDFSAGSISSTDVSTDAAINGAGFFVLDSGAGSQLYTQNGTFQLSANGTLESADGLAVMGYPAVNGAVNTNGGLVDINLPVGQVMQPAATTTFGMTQNLDSEAAAGSITSGQVQVFDSLGKSYEATVTYTNQGNNTWNYSVSLPDTLQANSATALGVTTIDYSFGASGAVLASVNPATNLTITGPTVAGTATIAAPAVVPGETVAAYATALQAAVTTAGIVGTTVTSTAGGQLSIVGTGISTTGSVIQDPVASAAANGVLTFDSSGNLVIPATNVPGISFAGLSDGSATMNLTFDLFGANGSGTVSQVAAASTTSSTNQNGFPSGQYQSFAINSSGVVAATYSNGQTQTVGQLAVATVNNEQGLLDQGSTEYQTTTASGNAAVGIAGLGGRGTINGSSLEASNVNISQEFSDLIIAQRAFEANSKAVTTFDSVTQETINMIH
ncbi:MAG: flagellar hook-basal body complex protein [Terracidiphilus sp.]|nr:flagellar hook-basal body complex protein [Terracidiphilus sp.]